MFSALLQLPARCEVCRSWPARALCEACVSRFAQPRPRCRLCALPLETAWAAQDAVQAPAEVCADCRLHPPPWQACLCAVDYAYPWSGVLARFKFAMDAGWAASLAQLMRSAPWIEPAIEAADVVVPMPLSAERLRERGFNQALLLARALAGPKVQAQVLLRIRHTQQQSALPLKDRLHNVTQAFAVEPAKRAQLQGQRVVLIDDVMTSGASLRAAAQPLLQAGIAHLSCIVLARTPKPIDWESDGQDG